MATPKYSRSDADGLGSASPAFDGSSPPPTYATFSPTTLSTTKTPTKSSSKHRSTILVHQKSPLLLATPPQITRALAYSHPFLLPLNKLAGLLSWTTGDPWESFLLLAAFWAVVLYGDVVIRAAGPIVVVLALILGMYGRRFSPLSSSGWSEPASREAKKDASSASSAVRNGGAKGAKSNAQATTSGREGLGHARGSSEVTNTRHQKTLDEIVETLKEFTARCNVLLEPLLELTDFLSTQRTPTSATVRPALTTLFIRILFCTPFWVALTLPPLRIITTRRVVLVFGTLVLSWHSRVMRVGRELLWRSSTVRRLAALTTGLTFDNPLKPSTSNLSTTSVESDGPARKLLKKHESELSRALQNQSHHHSHKHSGSVKDAGVKFTFILFENQRRWVGLGWTANLLAYERASWTDEHNHPVPNKDLFELPEVEDDSSMRWRWVEGSKWKVDGVPDDGKETVDYEGEAGKMGWVYYDNKWQNGRRGQDGWGRWTRRRKWYRDAELVEVEDEEEESVENDALPEQPRISTPLPPSNSQYSPTTQSYSTIEEKMISPIRAEHPSPNLDAARSSISIPRASEDSVPSTDLEDTPRASEESEKEKDKDPSDSASLLSTSSRSFFRAPILRRRPTDRSAVSATSVSESPAKDALRSVQERSRRASEVKSEDEVASLGAVGVELREDGKDGWGIGDDARMILE